MRKRSLAFDVLLALALLAAVQVEVWTGALSTHRQGPHWAQALGYGVAALALVGRRRVPLPSTLLLSGALTAEFVLFGSPEGFGVFALPLVSAYTVASLEERRRALWGLTAILAMGLAWVALDPATVGWLGRLQGLVWLTPWLVAWLLGAYRRTRRLYVQGLLREREERAAAAVSDERARIARELHDVIGHSVSVMTVQASAVRRLMRPDQVQEREALETVEATGREALTEMRRMVGVLRSADVAADLAPPPTLGQLGALVEHYRRTGLAVTVEVLGEPEPLPPGLDLTAYRLVQEALTNTLRHSGATCARVVVRHSPDSLDLTVCDNGRGPAATEQPGTGLLGMRERVAVYGGTLDTRTAEGGGFELIARLPLELR